MSDDLSVLAGMITPPLSAATFDTGTVTAVIDVSHLKVNLGDKQVKVFVPETLSNVAAVGSTVRVSVQENTYVLDSVVSGSSGGSVPVGSIVMWATGTIPANWLKLDGSTYSSATYPALFDVLGSTTLPDMRDRFPIGTSAGKAVTTTGGAASVTMTAAQMPSHSHTMSHTHDISHTHTMAHTHTMTHDHAINGWIFNGLGASGVHYGIGYQPNTGAAADLSASTETNAWNVIQFTGSTAGSSAANTGSASTSTSGAPSAANTGIAGTDSAMSVLNPYLSLNFIIKAK